MSGVSSATSISNQMMTRIYLNPQADSTSDATPLSAVLTSTSTCGTLQKMPAKQNESLEEEAAASPAGSEDWQYMCTYAGVGCFGDTSFPLQACDKI